MRKLRCSTTDLSFEKRKHNVKLAAVASKCCVDYRKHLRLQSQLHQQPHRVQEEVGAEKTETLCVMVLFFFVVGKQKNEIKRINNKDISLKMLDNKMVRIIQTKNDEMCE